MTPLLYKTVCVLVAGPIGSGKTTFCDMLLTEMYNLGWRSIKSSFSSRIKEIAHMMGWDGTKDEKGRKLLQFIGTECGRVYDPDVWVSYLIDQNLPNRTMYPFDIVIVDDWRFPNEREYIERNGLYDVYPMRIVRDVESNDHISEKALPDFLYHSDYYHTIIYNTGDLYSLQRSVRATSEYIKTKYNKGVK